MIAPLLDHLWQSTAMLAAIGVLTLFLRAHGAHVRHALWTAASLKFLLPFSLLAAMGGAITRLLSTPLPQPAMLAGLRVAAQPFSGGLISGGLISGGPGAMPAAAAMNWLPLLSAAWSMGLLAVCGIWLSRWWQLRATLRAARRADIAAPMEVRVSRGLLEPGLVGIFRPVLLLPEGIAARLTAAELDAIIAHESCHLARRDNLTAALHMLVEALFWFWPPVWWLGARLVAERERACDETVLAGGSEPSVYAEGILKVCRFYVASPLAAMAGATSGALLLRVEAIMAGHGTRRLGLAQKTLLAACAVTALALPIAAGMFNMHPVAMLQRRVVAAAEPYRAAEAFLRQAMRQDLMEPPPLAVAPVRRASAVPPERNVISGPAVPPLPQWPQAAQSAAYSAPKMASAPESSPAAAPAAGMAVSPGTGTRPAAARTVIVSGAGAARSADSNDFTPYLARVAWLVRRHLLVPVSLRAYARDREGGTALVHLVFRPDGSVQSAEIEKSSGFRGFDQAALEAARSASLPPLPPEAGPGRIAAVIPLDFTIPGG